MAAPEIILDLIERFKNNIDEYKSPKYNETQLRREFLDPFFEALDWDVNNRQGYALAYRDVIHEDAIKIGGFTKAPDYSFRIGGTRKFFIEAKKPSIYIKDDISPAFQLRRYAWSAKLPLSILTDFEEFAVYDTRVKPVKTDKASTARILFIGFDEYAERWDEIAGIFSREAILKGSFDKYAESNKVKRGTAEVDDVFLREIESWRDSLARNIALRNPSLSQRELNFAVQANIDRIIFLRICEDRGIEEYGRLMALQNGANVYARLRELFRLADERYNSGLFHFQTEKARPESPDSLTPGLLIDDKPLKEIFKKLYYPDSPYEFSVLSADILGQVYEQFLGKVIRLTTGHKAVVEDKPEVKKAGGVYYTPTYIVDYIVEQTVGKLLEGKTPRQASKLRVLDPACGSGSFLIGAYQYLLDWHLKAYSDDPDKHKKVLYMGPGGDWRLTTAEKKRILLNNIYGVDIDTQAVEVTKLSLLLKVLEGESDETLNLQLRLFHERALPDLGHNIKCGNSLIGTDFFEQQLSLLDEEAVYRINAFDWDKEFPEIMQGGGFDAIIGNPPYIRIQALKEWAPVEVEFYKKRYISASKGNYDIYVVFVERGLSLLNKRGRLGFILPHKFFNAKYGESLRELITKGRHLAHVVHFGDQQVFARATTYTCLMFLQKAGSDMISMMQADSLNAWTTSHEGSKGLVSSKLLTKEPWNLIVGEGAGLLNKLRLVDNKLEDATLRIFQGLKTGADGIFITEFIEELDDKIKLYSKRKQTSYVLEPDLMHPLIKGGDSKRYALTKTNRLILYPYKQRNDGRYELISELELKSQYPLTWSYLVDHKSFLEQRDRGRMKGPKWYGYSRSQAFDVITKSKIFTPDIAAHTAFSYDEKGHFFFTGGVAGGYGILVASDYVYEYILGLLNSKLTEWFIRQTATRMRGGYFSFESRFIRKAPIRTIDFSDPADKARHDKMVLLVERMLELNKQLTSANTPHEKKVIQTQIDATDRQIDNLVYELYGLTKEEIKIVEEATQ